jgi:hypothetical protein
VAECVVPSAPSLLEAIKGLTQAFDELPLILIPGGCLHVNFFVVAEFAVEICAVKVESVDLPVVACGDGEDNADIGESRD